MDLTLQALVRGRWWDAARLELPEPARGALGPCTFEYLFDYQRAYLLGELGEGSPLAAVSVHLPVEFGPRLLDAWPVFLDDLRPMGSARRWWLDRLGLPGRAEDDAELLRRGTVAPVGNLRIAEAVPPKDSAPLRFPRQSLIDREQGFLEHAVERGAQVGGATGAGGDAPKVLVRTSGQGEVWIDTWQDAPDLPDRHFLVKFARGRGRLDQDLLRAEYVYYRALAELGVDTVGMEGLSLEEGERGPSLWLPRFDVARENGRELRFGLESIYALTGRRAGNFLHHEDVLPLLQRHVTSVPWPSTLLDYLQRDLLNLLFGNSDNHGRNTALLKTPAGVRLAPLFDFAPMRLDPEGIVRTTRWARFERGGEVDWPALLHAFGPLEQGLREGLGALARRLRDLPDLLFRLGLPEAILHSPVLDLGRTEERLRRWTLL